MTSLAPMARHEVARAGPVGQHPRHVCPARHVLHPVGRQRHGGGHQRAADAGLGVFPRAVDIQHDDLVGQRQRGAERPGERAGAGVEVRLEADDDPRTRAGDLTGGAQRRRDLRRVVGVVVVQQQHLPRAPGTRTGGGRRRRRPRPSARQSRRPELDGGHRGTQRVQRHVLAGHGQPQRELAPRR